ncbi:MAG: hypothetical protein HON90_03340 [Halobacteriovoraceae bacterium]|jgi:putative GTP pyrophosphokinase|nr:hypothetical protein [Halobacteriovoraceae bacterium]
MISKRKVDLIGNKLKLSETLSATEFEQLLKWRNSFSSTLDYYYTKLKSKIPPEDRVAIARRLKRIDSIQIKLERFPTMRLSTLQDVAGLRVIFNDDIALDRAYTKIRGLTSRNTLKRLDDYHNRPKEDGYRGMHLIYQNESSSLVEIQFRTKLEHIWATAVETYGELQSTSFKTGEGDHDWKTFFKLLSSYFAIKEDCSPLIDHLKLSEKQILIRLKKSIKTLKVIERLNATTNSIKIIINKHNDVGRTGKYALLELDLEQNTTNIEIFNKKDVSKAIEIYTNKELELKDSKFRNIVFVNIENLENIQKSYPNYFLDTQKLLEILSKIVLGKF